MRLNGLRRLVKLHPMQLRKPGKMVRCVAYGTSNSFSHINHMPYKPLVSASTFRVLPVLHRHIFSASAQQQPTETDICSRRLNIFDVPGHVSEELCDIFLATGATSATVQEYRPEGHVEEEIFADGGPSRVWERCTVIAYFPIEESSDSIHEIVNQIVRDSMQLSCEHTIDDVKTEDWVAVIRESYQPVEVTKGLWIVPYEKSPIDNSAVNIILQPGLAFGTGDHPTTRLCLKWLYSQDLKGAKVLDYGTGSGILAIAALLLGANKAVGTDVDELAIRAASQNIERNNLADNAFSGFKVPPEVSQEVIGRVKSEGLFDVTIANILLGPLTSLAPLLAAATLPKGRLALSGILEKQAESVKEAYGPYFDTFEVVTLDNWALLTARRKNN